MLCLFLWCLVTINSGTSGFYQYPIIIPGQLQLSFSDGEMRETTQCINTTHTPQRPLLIKLTCEPDQNMELYKIIVARKHSQIFNKGKWCMAPEYRAEDQGCLGYENIETKFEKCQCGSQWCWMRTYHYQYAIGYLGSILDSRKCPETNNTIYYIHIWYNCLEGTSH